MKLISFDLYGNENLNNNGIITFQGVFFDSKSLQYMEETRDFIYKNELCEKINESKYSICHNYFSYDFLKLPCLKNHFEGKIDTLLIDCLINFNKESHHLIKSSNNDPLEDSFSAFQILEKCFVKFFSFSIELKSIIYSLLCNEKEYKTFFDLYNELNENRLKISSDNDIIELFGTILKKRNLYNKNSIEVLKSHIKEKLALSYIALFIEEGTIIIPKFIINNKKVNLNNFLHDFFLPIKFDLAQRNSEYLYDFTGFENYRGKTQKRGIENSIKNKDLLITLPTGGGKSLIYQLPAYILGKELGELTIIITPLKALIKDQVDSLYKRGYNEVDYLSGEQTSIEKDIVYKKVISGETKIIFITPEGLRSKKTLELFSNRYIGRVVIDEAHTIILWGQEFRPDYFFIRKFIEDLEKNNLNNKIDITLLTATAPIDVINGILKYFDNRNIELLKSEGILKENIKGEVININDNEDKNKILLNLVKDLNINDNPTIIFTGTRSNAESLEKILSDNGYNSKFFHAGLSPLEKKTTQEHFLSGDLNLIIATKAFGMGIDKSNIRYVIHFDLAQRNSEYLKRMCNECEQEII